MNDKKRRIFSARDCAYIAVFVALLIATQFALSFLPGVEFVTVLFISFSFCFGVRRGMVAGVVFSLLRQLVFGFFPTVLIVYLLYFPLLAIVFGFLGKGVRATAKNAVWLSGVAGICTIGFSMLDNLITPLWYGYTMDAMKAYFYGSLPLMIPQTVCAVVTVLVLFSPLAKVFGWANKNSVR